MCAVVIHELWLAGGTSALATTLPYVEPPTGLHVSENRNGPRTLSGVIPGVSSGESAFRTGMRAGRGYFDTMPRLLAGIVSKDRTVIVVAFDAALRSTAVRGLMVTDYHAGSAIVRYVFDDRQSFAREVSSIEETLLNDTSSAAAASSASNGSNLEAEWDAAATRAKGIDLSAVDFPDGSASAGVASGFTPHPQHGGEFVAVGAGGSFVRFGHEIALAEPGSFASTRMGLPTVAYTQDVTAAWIAMRKVLMSRSNAPPEHITVDDAHPQRELANGVQQRLLFGTGEESGRHMSYLASVLVFPPKRGLWAMTFNICWVAPERIQTDVPKAIAMADSYRPNQGVQQQETQTFNDTFNRHERAFTQSQLSQMAASRDANRRAFEASQQEHDEVATWQDQQGAAAIKNLAGNVVVFGAGNTHRTIPIPASDGFVPVPIDQLQKGVDY